jgi:hypothetical protein
MVTVRGGRDKDKIGAPGFNVGEASLGEEIAAQQRNYNGATKRKRSCTMYGSENRRGGI